MSSKGDRGGSRGMVRYLYYLKNSDTEKVRWARLSEQIFRVDKWSVCRG
jgi:hypothetical protein